MAEGGEGDFMHYDNETYDPMILYYNQPPVNYDRPANSSNGAINPWDGQISKIAGYRNI